MPSKQEGKRKGATKGTTKALGAPQRSKTRYMFRVVPEGRRWAMESATAAAGPWGRALGGLEKADVDKQVGRLVAHGCSVTGWPPREK